MTHFNNGINNASSYFTVYLPHWKCFKTFILDGKLSSISGGKNFFHWRYVTFIFRIQARLWEFHSHKTSQLRGKTNRPSSIVSSVSSTMNWSLRWTSSSPKEKISWKTWNWKRKEKKSWKRPKSKALWQKCDVVLRSWIRFPQTGKSQSFCTPFPSKQIHTRTIWKNLKGTLQR